MIKVFIVEDDPMLAQILSRFVAKVEGYAVAGIAYSCKDAIDKIVSADPQLILLDVYLDGSGLEILREVRKNDIKADVIMVTAAYDVTTISTSMRYGSVDYIIKPFEFARLKKALQNYQTMQEKLSKEVIAQHDIDSMIKITYAAESVNIPKNVDVATLNLIIAQFGETSYTAAEIADKSRISYGTVKRYLNYLVESEKVVRSLKYSLRGRPTVYYSKKH